MSKLEGYVFDRKLEGYVYGAFFKVSTRLESYYIL